MRRAQVSLVVSFHMSFASLVSLSLSAITAHVQTHCSRAYVAYITAACALILTVKSSESLAHVVSGIIRLGVLSVARIHAARYAKILTRGIHIAPAHHYNAHQIIPFSVAVCHRVQYGLRAVYISSVYAIAHILIFRVGAV